jgi:hypothetical protein
MGWDYKNHALPARWGSTLQRYSQLHAPAWSPEYTAHHGASEALACRGLKLINAAAATTKIVRVTFNLRGVSNNTKDVVSISICRGGIKST